MNRYLRILAVCTFNQLRSVAITAHLRARLAERGVQAHVIGAGFQSVGQPPTSEAVRALAHQGYDVGSHRSRLADMTTVYGADLIITAERAHVVRLCGDDVVLFARTFTLPELVTLGEVAGPRAGSPIADWVARVGEGRTHASFLVDPPPEIADPSGLAPSAVVAAMEDIGGWCQRLALLL